MNKQKKEEIPDISAVIDGKWKEGRDSKWRLTIPNAKQWLQSGLRHFLGDDAVWLPEYDEVAAWMEHTKGRGLLCIGDCGRGKTVITQKILPAVFANSLNLHFPCFTAMDLLERYEEIRDYKIIFIDDAGTEPNMKKYGVTHNYFSELVNLCERSDKMLICSTNLNREELIVRYGLRTMDRLTAITTRVFFEGESIRR
jgi:DNA replication protein DnaC